MPGYNHYPWCACGWCVKDRGPVSIPAEPWARRAMTCDSYVDPNARCPVCGADVFFYRSPYGGRVFFDVLGPPWPKHPCTDNGVPPPARLRSGHGPTRPPAWAMEGWSAVASLSLTERTDRWREVTATRVGRARPLRALLEAGAEPPTGSPVFVKGAGEDGTGRATWLDQRGTSGIVVREALFVHPSLGIVPPGLLSAALRGGAHALDEVALLLYAAVGDDADGAWITRLPAADLGRLRWWLARAAAAGGVLAGTWLARIDGVQRREKRARATGGGGDGNARPGPVRFPEDARLLDATSSYRVFTRRFDEVVDAADLVDEAQTVRLVRQLEAVSGEGGIGGEGGRPVVSPDMRDTLVTLLLDNSGSLRGRPIAALASLVRSLAEALTRAGATVEVLGFTTRAWKGGRSREVWEQQGRPRAPGRLADLRHIVYHPWDEPWRGDTWRRLAPLLHEELLKENVDGEALIWAYRRCLDADASKRWLLVFSDGAPVDDATLAANPGDYLSEHLASVVEAIEEHGLVSLVAVGLDHDPSDHYARSVTVHEAAIEHGLRELWRFIEEGWDAM